LRSVTSRNPRHSGAVLEAPAVVAGLDDVAMMGEAIEQGRGHLRIAEHARPFAKGQVCRDDHRSALVEAADKMEQKLSACLCEGQIAELIKDDEVEPREIISETSRAAIPSFGLEAVDQIDGVEEPAARSGANTASRDRHRQMRFAGTGPADQHDVTLLSDEAATGEIAHQRLVDRRVLELKAVEILGQRQLRDGQLVLDRALLLLGDLGLEQVAREALWFMPAFERRG